MEQIDQHHCFDGQQSRFRHTSRVTHCDMVFSVFLPPQAVQQHQQVPVLYWLSGLTCTDENFVTKAGAQQFAAQHGIAIVAPDTSPRGEQVPDDPEKAYDFGLGAGFYVDATEAPWSSHYHMYSYVTDELPSLIRQHFSVIDGNRMSISGHSMGGHGALTIALKNPDKYRSVSAFSPISSPLRCPWGEKALSGYLGDNREHWKNYDSTELIQAATQHTPMLVDQGSADNFLQEQLKPELLVSAAKTNNYPLNLRYQAGYDHSYFFIASFIADHLSFHATHLHQ